MLARLFYTGPTLRTLHEEYAKRSRIGEVRPDAPLHWKLGRVAIRSMFAVVDPPHELTWTGRFLGYNAVDQHLLEPAGGNRTKVTVRESLAGPLLPRLYRQSALQAGHQQWLTDLKAAVE